LAGAPPPQRPGHQDLKDLREIKARRARTLIGTAIEIKIAIVTRIRTRIATAMQARRHRARKDNIRPKTPTAGGLASETKDGVRPESGRG
jgi:hypothetical protein